MTSTELVEVFCFYGDEGMNADLVPLVVGGLIFVSSILSLKLGFSVAIIEILLGAIGGYFGLKSEEWMTYLAGFGGILLTYLAGTEIDTRLMREKFKESMLIGGFSFLCPFLRCFSLYLFCRGLVSSGGPDCGGGAIDDFPCRCVFGSR